MKRGFERLTPVQEAVLAPEISGRDLRVSSQTGSGKTVAIGLALRHELRGDLEGAEDERPKDNNAHPRAIVVVPTRELAKQVEQELAWLLAPIARRVISVTGGAGYRDELRSFRTKPAVVVGTPGRLLDHLTRGAIDAAETRAIVLDEADRMLDLGFREDIEAIFEHLPEEHRTHLMSATFPREVRALADRVQRDPAMIEATPLGRANTDIEHVLHLVHSNERLAAIVNLLLANAGSQTLIFAKTRVDVADLSDALNDAGFNVAMLSGEMDQPERNRALAAFKRGNVDALVATDVAARGIDVQGIDLVIHAEPPTDPDAYTHRSGRTGRAGRKGTSAVLVSPHDLAKTTSLLHRAKVPFRFAPVPSEDTILDTRDEALMASLTADFVDGEVIDPRSLAIAERVLRSTEPARAVARLVAWSFRRHVEPRPVTVIQPPEPRPRKDRPATIARPTGAFVAFRVSWGSAHGAEARRLVAMMCRRGRIEGRDIGAIRVGRTSSVVEVAENVADAFERATTKPDPRDPRIHIRRWIEPESFTRHPNDQPRDAKRRARESAAAPAEPRVEPRESADRPSKREVAERPSKRDVAERPSKREVAERPSKREVAERPSKREVAERPSTREVAERPSTREVAERPSKREVTERPSKREAERPPSRNKAERPPSRDDARQPPRHDAPLRPRGERPHHNRPHHPAPRPGERPLKRDDARQPPPGAPWKRSADRRDGASPQATRHGAPKWKKGGGKPKRR